MMMMMMMMMMMIVSHHLFWLKTFMTKKTTMKIGETSHPQTLVPHP
jgi:hypothetical protein